MRFDWWTFALQTVNFAILVWLLHRFLYRPVLRLIDARRAQAESQLAQAERARTEAQTRLTEIAAERAGIAAERSAAMEAAAAQAEEAATARRARAEREAQALLEGAHATLDAERAQALAQARRAALDLGVDIACRLLAEVPPGLRAEAWLERVERHLAELAPAACDELRAGLDGHGLRVVTAMALPGSTQELWRMRLRAVLGVDAAGVAFDVDPALIAGTELHFPNAVLRFSWRNALAALREEVEREDDAHAQRQDDGDAS